MESHIFSTGTLLVGAPGNTALTASANKVGVVQDVTFECSYQRKELFDAAQVSVFSVDSADSEGKCVLKFTGKDLARTLLPYLTGAAYAAGSSTTPDVYTITGASKPQYCRAEFSGIDTNGKNLKIVMTRAKAPGFTAALKLSDFADVQVELMGYVDANSTPVANAVATVSIDQ